MSPHTPSRSPSPDQVEEAIEDLKIKSESSDEEEATITLSDPKCNTASAELESPLSDDMPGKRIPMKKTSKIHTPKTPQPSATPKTPKVEMDQAREELIGGEITVKLEEGKPPKLARNSTKKIAAAPVVTFDDLPNKTDEATQGFDVIRDNIYANKSIGRTDEDIYECECEEEWDASTSTNHACGEDCINRMMRIECTDGCKCGSGCRNQRFQNKEFANVSVIHTGKKGYGLRTDTTLYPDDFIFEYLGEVIPEGSFWRRMHHYSDEGIKHFYFMMLTKGEYIDATRKGNLGRFCNHSCNPNCYVDKWNVGDQLRMGIFAKRAIKAGEELTFNYNVDRYGAEAQPCFCGELNCVGYIGGKTQSGGGETGQLSDAIKEALGIDSLQDWDFAIGKKQRKRKTEEDDEEYVENVKTKPLAEEGVAKVMATLKQTKEKWLVIKLLDRITQARDERVINYVVKMHGYPTLKTTLATFKEDLDVVSEVLAILWRFPRLTRNKIEKVKIEETVHLFESCDDEKVASRAKELLQEWSTLETGYRIPRRQGDAAPERNKYDRREDRPRRSRSRSPVKEKSKSPPRGPSAPTGPRSNVPQRNFAAVRPPPRPRARFPPLPTGWFAAYDGDRLYYYNRSGTTTWERPTLPAAQPPPPPKPEDPTKALNAIISNIQAEEEKKAQMAAEAAASAKAKADEEDAKSKEHKSKDWRSLSSEKQRKIYENTIWPVAKRVVDKYKDKLPREDLKRFFKEQTKKLVESDFKHGRVENPKKLTDKQEREIKKYLQSFFDKAVQKKVDHDKKKARKGEKGEKGEKGADRAASNVKEVMSAASASLRKEEFDAAVGTDLSDGDAKKDDSEMTPFTPLENGDSLKRKRGSNGAEEGETPTKRARSITPPAPTPPPPPPASEKRDSVSSSSRTSQSPNGIKRKRDMEEVEADTRDASPSKRARSLTPAQTPPPPPPPPIDGDEQPNSSAGSNPSKRKRDHTDEQQIIEHASPSKRARSSTPPTDPVPPPPPPAYGGNTQVSPPDNLLGSVENGSSKGITHADAPDGEATASSHDVESVQDGSGMQSLRSDRAKFVEAQSG